jgi:hypothetical protein
MKWFLLVIIGAIFLILGICAIIWGNREEKHIFDVLSKKPDLREFSQRHVDGPQPGALKIGGWIAIALGVVIIVAGIVFWQTGWMLD